MQQIIEQLEHEHDITVLYLTIFGSKLFGTSDHLSDTDYKGIFIPNSDSMLLANYTDSIDITSGNEYSANSAEDQDLSLWSIQKWFSLLNKGDTNALDLLFSIQSNQEAYIDSQFKELILTNYKSLLSKQPNSFLGYCKSQANKYNLRGKRYNGLVAYLGYLKAFDDNDKLSEVNLDITSYHGIEIVQAPAPAGRGKPELVDYLQIDGKKFILNLTVGHVKQKLTTYIENYGNRIKENVDNIDYKSLSHAVRVAVELEELLSEHTITFPLLDADYIYAVKRAKVPHDQVLTYLEEKFIIIDQLLESTTLPDKPDRELMNQLILQLYKD